jgi:hypothetical protein
MATGAAIHQHGSAAFTVKLVEIYAIKTEANTAERALIAQTQDHRTLWLQPDRRGPGRTGRRCRAPSRVRVSEALKRRGLSISSAGVRCVWQRHELTAMKLRLNADDRMPSRLQLMEQPS